MLPWDKRGDLQGYTWSQTDPSHWCITSHLNLGSRTRLKGGPDTPLGPGYHIGRGAQRRHWPSPEPLQSEGGQSSDRFQADGPFSPLPTALAIPTPEDVVTGETRNIVVGKM